MTPRRTLKTKRLNELKEYCISLGYSATMTKSFIPNDDLFIMRKEDRLIYLVSDQGLEKYATILKEYRDYGCPIILRGTRLDLSVPPLTIKLITPLTA
jgi:hypothetical protein